MYYEKQISSQNCWILVVIVHLNGYNGAHRMSQVPFITLVKLMSSTIAYSSLQSISVFFNLRLPKIIQSMRWKWDKFSPRFNLVAFSPRGSLGGWVAAAQREQHHVSGHLTLPTMFNLFFLCHLTERNHRNGMRWTSWPRTILPTKTTAWWRSTNQALLTTGQSLLTVMKFLLTFFVLCTYRYN